MTTSTGSGGVTGTAKEETRRVGGVAKQEAANVAGEAKAQARNLAGDLRREVTDQSRTQQQRLAGLLAEFGDELEQMARSSDRSGLASDVAGQVAERTRQVGRFIQDREPGDLLDEVRRFAGRRPGAFLLGALAAGVVAGRLTRGVAQAHGVGSGDEGMGTSDGGPQHRAETQPVRPVVPVTEPAGAEVPPTTEGYGGPAPTGPAVDPVEPGYDPAVRRPGGLAP